MRKQRQYVTIKDNDYYWVERTPKNTVEKTVRKVEQHFGFFKEELIGFGNKLCNENIKF